MIELTSDVFVGRTTELGLIHAEVSQPTPGVRLISIQGEGGIGKTSLLKKIRADYHDDFFITEILDFFSTSTHTPDGFLDMLIQCFPAEAFKEYREEKHTTDAIRFAGFAGPVIEEHNQKARKAFCDAFIQQAQQQPLVILIDTFEIVQATMGTWLLDLVADIMEADQGLARAVFIITGRSNPEWQTTLAQRFPHSVSICLGPLEKTAVDELITRYLTDLPAIVINPEERQKIDLLTNRHPLLVALTLDWEGRRGITQESVSSTTGTYALKQLQSMPAETLQTVRVAFEKELVHKFHDPSEPTSQVIWMMAHVYKRFDAEILAWLYECSLDEAKSLLATMQTWVFVKYDPRTATYQLHDKMRDMIAAYIWPNVDAAGYTRQSYSAKMRRYCDDRYQTLIHQVGKKIAERQQAFLRVDRAAEALAKKGELYLRSEMNVWAAHRVYYDILAYPDEGLARCNEAIVGDIWATNENGFKLKQYERAEALAKLNRILPEYVMQLEEARKLTVLHVDRRGALALLERLDTPELFAQPEVERSTLQADVKIYEAFNIMALPPLAEAPPEQHDLVRRWAGEHSPLECAHARAQEAIDLLRLKETAALKEAAAFQEPPVSVRSELRLCRRSLARAYQVQAYTYSQLGRFMESIDANRERLHHAQLGEMRVNQAGAENDMAYSYAQLGKFHQAEHLVNKGLEIRETMGLDYYIGLSLNTRAAIYFLEDKLDRAWADSERALAIFHGLDARSGIGLANLTLGKIKERMGDLLSRKDYLEQARAHLLEAADIFGGRESMRLAETYEWLGILFMVLGGNLYAKLGREFKGEMEACLAQANNYFSQAVDFYRSAGKERQWALALERWARVDLDQGNSLCEASVDTPEAQAACRDAAYKRVDDKLDEAESIALKMAPEIQLKPVAGESAGKSGASSLLHYRMVLGKVERLRGRLAFDRFKKAAAPAQAATFFQASARHFMLAAAYCEQFSPEARELESVLTLVNDRIRTLPYEKQILFGSAVRETQREYGLGGYSKLPVYIEEITVSTQSETEG